MIEITNLTKNYPKFKLDQISFNLPKGYIMGFIGRNGAGKSTTLKAMLNIVLPDDGDVKLFGLNINEHELAIKQRIGLMLGPIDYYPNTKIKKIVNIYKKFYTKWDDLIFDELIQKFRLDVDKKVKDLSSGMKVKLGLTLALSHDAELIILDEPTSGLDPLARDELLDIFQEIIGTGEKSILFSTHITSDLDKCADYILFVDNGKVILNNTKDDIILNYSIIKGNLADLPTIKKYLIGYKENAYGFSGLIKKVDLVDSHQFVVEVPTLEDILVYYSRENS